MTPFLQCLILAGMIAPAICQAELRTFTSTTGQSMEAELVSYRGLQVTLRRQDGQQFTVTPNVFSPEDQIHIRKWMSATPETVDHAFRISASRKRVTGSTNRMEYIRLKTTVFAYEIEILSLSRDVLSDLTINYRIFFEDRANETGYIMIPDSSSPELKVVEGKAKQEREVSYNQSISITSDPVTLHEYEDSIFSQSHEDELKGCLIRITDAAGNVVEEWAEPVTSLSGLSWESPAKVDQAPGDPQD